MTKASRPGARDTTSLSSAPRAVDRLRLLIGHAARTSRHGDGLLGRSRCFAWYMMLPAKRRLPWLTGRTVVLRLRVGGERRRLAFSDRSELIAFEEIFCDGEYDLPLRRSPSTIIDAGANVGASVLWYRSKYPQARIIAVEPDPTTVRKLTVTLAGVPGVEIVAAALTKSAGRVQMVQSAHSWASRVVDEQSGLTVGVQGISLGDLLRDRGLSRVDLLKLDIEGSEWDVLPDAVAVADDIVVEVHGEDRLSRLNALAPQFPSASIAWVNDRVAHLRCDEPSVRR